VNVGRRPIVFIAHSVGGLVLKRLLVDCKENDHDGDFWQLLNSTVAVIFFATPHKGSKKLAELAPNFLRTAATPISSVLNNVELLQELDDRFDKFVKTGDREESRAWIKVCNFWETRPLDFTGLPKHVLVDKQPLSATSMVVDRNHFGAGQIDSSEDPAYVAILHLLNTIIKWRNPLRLSNSKALSNHRSVLNTSPPVAAKSKQKRVFGEEEDNEEFPQATIGYLGKLKREEAEIKLMSSPPGTFLTRWSEHTESYVVSYHDIEDEQVKHIAHLRPDPVTGSISEPSRLCGHDEDKWHHYSSSRNQRLHQNCSTSRRFT
jgi:hypothetical protein